jgi:very-short-patch-repair endonuclease
MIDFYCPAKRLAIELDGGQHFEPAAQAYDRRRTHYLCRRGIIVLRFATNLVFTEHDGVLDAIALALGIVGPSP